MFEIGGVYANRKGEYTVIELNPPKMYVRYRDGTEAELKIGVQARIWENISAEYEAKVTARNKRTAQKSGVNHYIKVISLSSIGELTFPGWQERVVMGPSVSDSINLKAGDRLIFYALESQTFFAVATITGEAKVANPQDYFFPVNANEMSFFPIDIDTVAFKLENGAYIDSVELESQPRFKRLRLEAETFLPINEDDFELLAEALTEVAEEEDIDDDDDDFEEDDD